MERAGGYAFTAGFPALHQGFAGAGVAPWAKALEWAAVLLLKLVSAHAAARRTKATLEELRNMDERALQDVGLTLGDVYAMTGTVPKRFLHQRDWG